MYFRRLILLIGLLLLASAAHFRGGGIEAGPYLQDPSPTSMWVCWETSGNTESVVEYGTTPLILNSASGSYLNSSGGTIIHQVYLTGLLPSTTYWYRVKTGSWYSDIAHFQTPPLQTSEASWRFAAVSDTQLLTPNRFLRRSFPPHCSGEARNEAQMMNTVRCPFV